MGTFREYVHKITNISDDIDWESASSSIRNNINFKGHNIYILAFAIIIASVGLNVNSIPVIIGAMLISPLMGPIIGFGLGLGTNDTRLLKASLVNLATMMVISILASTIYFALSPLKLENPTELLARTNPTIYDVLIALFGGFAGIFEMSRKNSKGGTVLSGVAIATALMPPLCTVGYGLATLQFRYALGAFYLFCINSIFIALSTYVTVRFLKFPEIVLADKVKEKKLKRTILLITIIVIIPSVITAVSVIKENNFNSLASNFVKHNKTVGKGYIYDYKTTGGPNPTVEISMAGGTLDDADKEHLYEAAEEAGLKRKQLTIKESAIYSPEMAGADGEILEGVMRRNDAEIRKRETTIMDMEKQLNDYKSREIPYAQIAKEVAAQYPGITSISLTRGASLDVTTFNPVEEVVATVNWKAGTSARAKTEGMEKIASFLKVRLNFENVRVISQ